MENRMNVAAMFSGRTMTFEPDLISVGRPLLYGPIVVEVDNGTDVGHVRTKVATIQARLKSDTEIDDYLPGDEFRLNAQYEGVSDWFTLLWGVITEIKAAPGPDDSVNLLVTFTSDKKRFEYNAPLSGSGTESPIWDENTSTPILYPETDGYMQHITNLFPLGTEASGIDCFIPKPAGYAWYDGADTGTGWWPHRLGTGRVRDMSTLERIENGARATGTRYAMEDGRAWPFVAKYAAEPPYMIPADCIVANNEFLSTLADKRNRLTITHRHVEKVDPVEATADYVKQSGDRDPTYVGIVEEAPDYADWLWELSYGAEGERPRDGQVPLSMQMLVEKLAQRPRMSRNLDESQVLLNRLADKFGPTFVHYFVRNIFSFQYYYEEHPFLPSVICEDAAGIDQSTLYGIVEKATLTITPRKNLVPKATLDITLGPGDGLPGDAAPLGGRFKDISRQFKNQNEMWSPHYA